MNHEQELADGDFAPGYAPCVGCGKALPYDGELSALCAACQHTRDKANSPRHAAPAKRGS